MAPSSGHLLVPKAFKILRFAFEKTASVIRSTVAQSKPGALSSAQPIRVLAHAQPVHPIALLKQSRAQSGRWFSTSIRKSSSALKANGPKYDRSTFPVSRTSRVISQRGIAPFASTLRPNLTGGCLPRTAGGSSLGGAGKARHFSHTGGCQAQVVNNVNAGVRAFFVGGGKARFDGMDHATGEKKFRGISKTQETVYGKWKAPRPIRAPSSVKGTSLEFRLSPTITALSPTVPTSGSEEKSTDLNSPDLLSTLGGDFARALRDLSIIRTDLNKLATFGDLPLSLCHTPDGPVLRVRFPGCDGELVASLCDEVGVRRGLIKEDEAWLESKDVEMALLFPLAPTGCRTLRCGSVSSSSEADQMEISGGHYFQGQFVATREERKADQLDWRKMVSSSDPAHSLADQSVLSFEEATLQSLSGYESLQESDFSPDDPYYHTSTSPRTTQSRSQPEKRNHGQEDYEGLEGIYKFLQECDDARR